RRSAPFEEPAHRRVVTVGRDDEAGTDRLPALAAPDGRRDAVGTDGEGEEPRGLEHRDADRARVPEQRGVEVAAGRDRRVLADAVGAGRQRQRHPPARRPDDHRLRHRRRDLEARHLDAEPSEQAQRSGREAVAAGLVAREGRLVDEQDLESGGVSGEGGGAAGRPGADDEDVDGVPVSRRWHHDDDRRLRLARRAARGPESAVHSRRSPPRRAMKPVTGIIDRSQEPMHVAVCVKQIPDPAMPGELDPGTNTLKREGKLILDESDSYGVEMALQLVDKAGSGEVTLVSMAPNNEVSGLRTALAMGAAKAVLVSDPALAGSDALSTAKVLAKAIERAGDVDLVLTATESTDGYTGTVPAQIAELLGWPSLTFAKHVDIADGKVTIQRQTEAGYDVVSASLPAVVSVTAGVVEPRYPSFKGIMAAKNKPVDQCTASDLGLGADQVGWAGARQTIVSVGAAPARE